MSTLTRGIAVTFAAAVALVGVESTTPAHAATTYPCAWSAAKPVQLTPYGEDYYATDVMNRYASPTGHAARVRAEWEGYVDEYIRLAEPDDYAIGSIKPDGSLYARPRIQPSDSWAIITPSLSALYGDSDGIERSYRMIYQRPTISCGAGTSSASSQGVYAQPTVYQVDPTSSTTVAGSKVRSLGSFSTYVGSSTSYASYAVSQATGTGTFFLHAPAKSATLSNGDVVSIPAWTSAKVTLSSGWITRNAAVALKSSKAKKKSLRTLGITVSAGDPVTTATLYKKASNKAPWKRVSTVPLRQGRAAVQVKKSATARYRVSVSGYTSPVQGFRPATDSIYHWTSATSRAVRAR